MLSRLPTGAVRREASAKERALRWARINRIPGSGIRVHHKSSDVSMEVTGYWIPTLNDAGEKTLARDLAAWEASVQSRDGSFAAPDAVPYTFDTAQVIRGFLAMLEEMPELEGPLRRACDYVERQISPDGRVTTPSYAMWALDDGSTFTEYAHLYVLPPLREAGQRLGVARYADAAARALGYYKRQPDLVEFKPEISVLSHIFGYMMEALVELDELSLARRGLEQAASIQKENGAIPAFPGVDWVCSTGVAQLALAWYRIGEGDPADKAIDYLIGIQNPSGGFYGSYGRGGRYFPVEEISWAPKFFLDALYWQERLAPGARDERSDLAARLSST